MGWWLHLNPPRHLVFLGAFDLTKIMQTFGFELVTINYFSLEQNPFGMQQSILNSLLRKREVLFEVLKGNRSYACGYSGVSILPQKMSCILTFPLFALLNRLIHSVPTIISGCCCFPYISETGSKSEYSLKNYLDRDLKVTVNADNPGISRTDFSRELHRAARLTPGGLSIWGVLKIVRNGFKASFAEHAIRNRLLREAEAEIIDLVQKGIPQ